MGKGKSYSTTRKREFTPSEEFDATNKNQCPNCRADHPGFGPLVPHGKADTVTREKSCSVCSAVWEEVWDWRGFVDGVTIAREMTSNEALSEAISRLEEHVSCACDDLPGDSPKCYLCELREVRDKNKEE